MEDTPWYKEDPTKVSLWKAVFAEALATLIFVFVGCGSIISFGIQFSVERVAFAFGLAIASLVQATGAISGGHINPAVTVAMLATQKISPLRCVLYVLAQLTGAIVGASILYGVTPSTVRGNLGGNKIGPLLSAGQGLGCEIILTFLLVMVIFAATDPHHGAGKVAPLAIGLTVTVAHLMGVPFSGAGMNPARSFGPAVVTGDFPDHWIYWLGPLLGGVAGAFVYTYALTPKREKEDVVAGAAAATEAGHSPMDNMSNQQAK